MATPAGTLVARLTRIRAENRIGKVVAGLGTINVPFARQHGTSPLAVQVGRNRVEELRATTALARPDVQAAIQGRLTRVEGTANKSLTEALLARKQATQALRQAGAAQAAASSGGTALSRLRQRTSGRGTFLIARGLRVARSPTAAMRSIAMRSAGPLMIAHLGVGAATMATEGMSNAIEAMRRTESRGEAARTAGARVAETGFKVFLGDALTRLVGSVGKLSNTVNPNSFNTQEFDRRREEMFMSREAVDKRRAERKEIMAEVMADSERKIAEARQFINDYTPSSFTIATRHDRQAYRSDLWRANRVAYHNHVTQLREGAAANIRELE